MLSTILDIVCPVVLPTSYLEVASVRPASANTQQAQPVCIHYRLGNTTFMVVLDNVTGLVAEHDEAYGDTGASEPMFRSFMLSQMIYCIVPQN